MLERLAAKTCLVTGSAQGIGLRIVEAFAREGANVLASDIDIAALGRLSGDPGISILQLDVTDSASTCKAAEEHPGVHVLVNCVGYVAVGSVLECTEEDFRRTYDINVRSIFNTVRAFLPGMVRRGHGTIINIASVVSARKAAANRFAYAASKAAVVAMTRSIALDYIKNGIRCNSISPGTIDTPSLGARVSASPDPDQALQSLIGRQPLGRLGRASEIAAMAVLLASDEVSFMTGADLVVDGGMSL
jgi:2-keto-3-deoxy-L-fuconate dehydrogenase